MLWAPADATRHDKRANASSTRRKWTEAVDRTPTLFEMERTEVIPWSAPNPRDAPDTSTRILKGPGTKHDRGNSTATRMTSLPASWPEEVKARAKTGEARDKADRFRRAVQDAAEFAKEMASIRAPSTDLTRTPLVLKTKEVPTGVQHVTGIIDKLSKSGKPIPKKLNDLLATLKRTPLSTGK